MFYDVSLGLRHFWLCNWDSRSSCVILT